jgi:hypothetical protein
MVLDPREGPITPEEDGSVRLKYPPPMIYFKPETETFEGVPKGIIPISPSKVNFSVEVEGKKTKSTAAASVHGSKTLRIKTIG